MEIFDVGYKWPLKVGRLFYGPITTFACGEKKTEWLVSWSKNVFIGGSNKHVINSFQQWQEALRFCQAQKEATKRVPRRRGQGGRPQDYKAKGAWFEWRREGWAELRILSRLVRPEVPSLSELPVLMHQGGNDRSYLYGRHIKRALSSDEQFELL